MKKFAWIIALLAALSLGFFACTEPDGTAYQPPAREVTETEWVTIFDMQDAENGTVTHGIQELGANHQFDFSTAAGKAELAPLAEASDNGNAATFKTITGTDGKIGFEFTTKANWGVGFDLPYAAFGFLSGDKVKITGKIVTLASGGKIQLNRVAGSGEYAIGSATAGSATAVGDFTLEVTLTATDISAIQGSGGKALRFEARETGNVIQITQIEIEGERPSNVTTLTAPVISLDVDSVTWPAVTNASGYRVYAVDPSTGTTAKPAEPVLIETLGPSARSVNLKRALNGKAETSYNITVVAVGTTGSINDSPASNVIAFNFTVLSVGITVKVDGTAETANVILLGKTAEFAAITDGYKVSAGHNSTSFPAVVVDFGTTKLSGIASISFDAKQVAGDIQYKRFMVSAADAANTANFLALTRRSTNRWEGATSFTTTPLAVNLPVYNTLVTDSGLGAKTKLAFYINPYGIAATGGGVDTEYEITNIEITTGVPAPDEEIPIALFDVALTKPAAGAAPQTTVSKSDAAENSAYTGTVVWTPSSSTFNPFVPYTAAINLAAAKTYKLPTVYASGYKVNGEIAVKAEDATDGDNPLVFVSNGGVGFIYVFGITLPPGPLGKLYDMLEDTAIQNASDGDSWSSNAWFKNNGATVVVNEDDDHNYLAVTGRDSDWKTILINCAGDASTNYSTGRKHTITVTGKSDGAMRFQKNGGDYGYLSSAVTPDGERNFVVTQTFEWADLVSMSDFRLSAAVNIDYEVYNITITAVP